MKLVSSLMFLGSLAEAHYVIPSISANGVSRPDWQSVRRTSNWQNVGPIEDVFSQAMTCYELQPGPQGATVLDVTANGVLTFGISPVIFHPGPINVYMARAPSGNVLDFDGKGNHWFKVYGDTPTFTESGMVWPSDGKGTVSITIPRCIANGEYLVRFEHIALHQAFNPNGAQFYLSCAQVRVNGGTGTASPSLMSFPGAYSPTDPNLLINVHWPIPTSYTSPGGRPLVC